MFLQSEQQLFSLSIPWWSWLQKQNWLVFFSWSAKFITVKFVNCLNFDWSSRGTGYLIHLNYSRIFITSFCLKYYFNPYLNCYTNIIVSFRYRPRSLLKVTYRILPLAFSILIFCTSLGLLTQYGSCLQVNIGYQRCVKYIITHFAWFYVLFFPFSFVLPFYEQEKFIEETKSYLRYQLLQMRRWYLYWTKKYQHLYPCIIYIDWPKNLVISYY